MKEGIHPKYDKSTVKCACGETFTTGSTKNDLHVDICSKCHPFFTGKQKIVDSGGRVERFNRKFGLSEDTAKAAEPKQEETENKEEIKEEEQS